MSEELEHIWSRLSARLCDTVGEATYRIWLEPLTPLRLHDRTLVLAAPEHAQRWVQDRFGRVLADAAIAVLGPGASVELVPGGRPSASAGASAPGEPAPSPLGNPKLTFDQFVIGDSNRLAHAASLTVAEMPAQAYNPLFICGPPGVGKTHLLSSIADLIAEHEPALSVRLTTGEAFTNAFLGALAHGETNAFKSRFRGVDVLLVDDVQFLEHKTRTEEEFFHTFNALYDGGRQIVLTSDRPPGDLRALEDRLRERFQSGLVADVAPPDVATRLAILRKRAQHDALALHDERPLELIATRVQTNVRALEGALIRVVAYSSLTGRQITAELVEEVLTGLYPQPRSERTIADVQAAACAHFGITADELLSPRRTPAIAWPRQLAMYLARELTDQSLPAIGREFGGRDHTTVMHACRRASERIATDTDARRAVENLCDRLGTPLP
ncbi:MAG TPA: chromosomal replication initiator protein DnaA [Solirubrobacteraceae bacterium]|nr:chromosomal replication initiator protein DnaA [Solirubrobacteraceae bacterium]